jgi:hypothetical protein
LDFTSNDYDPETGAGGLGGGKSDVAEEVQFSFDVYRRSRSKRRHLLTRSDFLRLATTSLIHIETKFLRSDNPLLGLITLSVKTLIQSLGGATECPTPSGCQVVPLAAKGLQKIMLSNGWCIHQCDRVCRSHNVDTVYYLSMLPR